MRTELTLKTQAILVDRCMARGKKERKNILEILTESRKKTYMMRVEESIRVVGMASGFYIGDILVRCDEMRGGLA